jgi:hypothetical protein
MSRTATRGGALKATGSSRARLGSLGLQPRAASHGRGRLNRHTERPCIVFRGGARPAGLASQWFGLFAATCHSLIDFSFLTRRDVEATNNESHRDLRPFVIFVRSRTASGRTGAPRSTPISAPLSEPAASTAGAPSPPSAPLSRCVPSSPPPFDHWAAETGEQLDDY